MIGTTKPNSYGGGIAAFRDIVKYVGRDGDRRAIERGEVVTLKSDNLFGETADDIAAEMANTARLGRCKNPALHIVLGYAKDERPTAEQMRSDIETVLRARGIDPNRHQWFAGVHRDTDDLHLHIVANRVSPEARPHRQTGRPIYPVAPDHLGQIETEKAVARIALERGWRVVPGRHNAEVLEAAGHVAHDTKPPRRNMTDRKGAGPTLAEAAGPGIQAAAATATTWREFHSEVLRSTALIAKRTERPGKKGTDQVLYGMVFVGGTDPDAPGVKASGIGIRLADLEARFGPYQPPTESHADYATNLQQQTTERERQAKAAAPPQTRKPAPPRSIAEIRANGREREAAFARYTAERTAARAEHEARRNQAKAEAARKMDAAKIATGPQFAAQQVRLALLKLHQTARKAAINIAVPRTLGARKHMLRWHRDKCATERRDFWTSERAREKAASSERRAVAKAEIKAANASRFTFPTFADWTKANERKTADGAEAKKAELEAVSRIRSEIDIEQRRQSEAARKPPVPQTPPPSRLTALQEATARLTEARKTTPAPTPAASVRPTTPPPLAAAPPPIGPGRVALGYLFSASERARDDANAAVYRHTQSKQDQPAMKIPPAPTRESALLAVREREAQRMRELNAEIRRIDGLGAIGRFANKTKRAETAAEIEKEQKRLATFDFLAGVMKDSKPFRAVDIEHKALLADHEIKVAEARKANQAETDLRNHADNWQKALNAVVAHDSVITPERANNLTMPEELLKDPERTRLLVEGLAVLSGDHEQWRKVPADRRVAAFRVAFEHVKDRDGNQPMWMAQGLLLHNQWSKTTADTAQHSRPVRETPQPTRNRDTNTPTRNTGPTM